MPNSGSPAEPGALVRHSSWEIYRRVIGALLIRELITRYGRNNIGFLWLFVEPALFIIIVTIIRGFVRTTMGHSVPIFAFALTGYASLLLWRNCASRGIGAVKANRALLFHRQVTIVDIFTARMILEVAAITTAVAGLALALWAFGLLEPPEDVIQFLFGWMLLAWFAIGLGFTLGGLSEKWEVVGRLWSPLSYILMVNSGAFYLLQIFPEHVRNAMLWVPMLNAVEYMRDAWFGSTFTAYYDLNYLILFNVGLSIVGFSLVRQVAFDSSDE
ncbi:ABC transporter permease [Sphingomonas sabuli]|uniref:ABC transporter permease n=1 Tax=Sphingomonas sabuli TaxID=2764186 RepID=A0A7G9L5A4_9SPHN|nr:ABC transporter permease [Sphingomonas sabuli]QNM83803.1 ABC transporter permease [Sphingomonas sabuli]